MKKTIYKTLFFVLVGVVIGYIIRNPLNREADRVFRFLASKIPPIQTTVNNMVPTNTATPPTTQTAFLSVATCTLNDWDKRITAKFTLLDAPGFIEIIKPTEDEVLTVGQPYTIEWRARAKFSKVWVSTINEETGTADWILTDTPDTGKIEWVPNGMEFGKFRISIQGIGPFQKDDGSGMSAESSAFTIKLKSRRL